LKKWILLFISLLGVDAFSKFAALNWLAPLAPKAFGYPFGGVPIFEALGISFSLNLVGNTGAAWGLFQGNAGLLFGLRFAIIGALIGYLLFFNRGRSPALPLWLVATGAVGNAIDYWAYGFVVDFFHFCFWGYSFPIFNIADSCITVGVAFLLLAPEWAKLRAAR